MHPLLLTHDTHTRTAENATAVARYAANVKRFEDQVDPERKLTVEERARRVVAARKAYFRRLALKSAQARRKKSSKYKDEDR